MAGDEGAGWWIGRQGLIAALSAADGREGASPRLLAAAQERFGPIVDLPRTIADTPSPIATVAHFAADVADAARTGDPEARDIWARAAVFIGRAICAAATRTQLTNGIDYTIIGGIAASADLLEPALSAHMTERLGHVNHVATSGTSLEGARALATLRQFDTLGPLAAATTTTPKDGLQ